MPLSYLHFTNISKFVSPFDSFYIIKSEQVSEQYVKICYDTFSELICHSTDTLNSDSFRLFFICFSFVFHLF